MTIITLDHVESPLGNWYLAIVGQALAAVGYAEEEVAIQQKMTRRYKEVFFQTVENAAGIRERFQAYFAGDVHAIDTIPVDTGGTPFQQQVWQNLRSIPAGSTWSYADMAVHVGRPTAYRAVGAANGQNPVALVLPCHRVIGSNASLTGYAGGLERKKWLLEHERKHARS